MNKLDFNIKRFNIKRLNIKLLIGVFLLFQSFSSSNAQTVLKEGQTIGETGLALPRFVSLSAGEANLRTGPGDRYPILWVYVKRGIPLEITAEYGTWRRVRDVEGTTGWMHSALLSGTRTSLITGSIRTIYAEPNVSSRAVLRAEPNVNSVVESCDNGWCLIHIMGREGWIPQEHIWGTYSFENIK
jgi:SH3-like domain-containing protein